MGEHQDGGMTAVLVTLGGLEPFEGPLDLKLDYRSHREVRGACVAGDMGMGGEGGAEGVNATGKGGRRRGGLPNSAARVPPGNARRPRVRAARAMAWASAQGRTMRR